MSQAPEPSNTRPQPYRTTPIFDEISLPAGLRREHRTKVGVWGVIRILEGRLNLRFVDPPHERLLEPGSPGYLQPDQPHFVELIGPMRMQIDFYDRPPERETD